MTNLKNIIVLAKEESPWRDFLGEYFEETKSNLVIFSDAKAAMKWLESNKPFVAFIESEDLTLALSQRLKVLKDSDDVFRMYHLGAEKAKERALHFDAFFENFENYTKFQKLLFSTLPFNPEVDVLIADDEKEIGEMLIDFLQDMVSPKVNTRYAADGEEALQQLSNKQPDILVLDVKMPKKDGREVYKTICDNEWKFPVIIFYDAVSSQEASEIHAYGKPSILEKGSSRSSPPELHRLILKMIYFS